VNIVHLSGALSELGKLVLANRAPRCKEAEKQYVQVNDEALI
jgi:hypothetical protein